MVAVAAAAILLRVAVQVGLGFFEHPETWEEGTIAADLAAGRGYGYEQFGVWQQAFRGPGYPLLLGLAYVVLGTSAAVAGGLNALLGGATAAIAVMLGRRIWGRPADLIAGLLVAAHPGLLIYSAKIHQLTLDALLIALFVLLTLRAVRDPRLRSAVASGIVGAGLALSRPTALPYVGIAAVLVALGSRAGRGLLWSVVMVVVAFALSSVWVARNWAVTGEATLSSSTGLFMWTGNNPNATGAAATEDGRGMWETDAELFARVQGRDEVEQDRIFREAALRYIAEDPWRTARNVGSRFVTFWWFGPVTGLNYPASWFLIYAGYYLAIVGLALVGAMAMVRRRLNLELLAVGAMIGVVGSMQALFYVEGRHRWAIEPLMLVVAAVGIAEVARATLWRARRSGDPR